MNKEFLYGINPVKEAILAGKRKIFELYYSETKNTKPVVTLARKKGIKASAKDKSFLSKIAGTDKHQGLVLAVSPFNYSILEDILDGRPDNSFIDLIMLDGVTDPRNLGAIIRSAYLLDFSGVIIGKHRSAYISPTVVKTSAGATEWLPVIRETNLSRVVDFLKKNNFWIVCATEKGKSTLTEPDYNFNTLLVLGDEGRGLRNTTLKRCDFTVKIPICSQKGVGSLNVSVASAIMMYEIKRSRGISPC